MAESSSTGPLEGEALRLLEPAIRPLSPNTKHIRAAEFEGCVLNSRLLLGGEVAFRGCFARVYFLGRVKLDDAREKATRVAGGGRSRGDAAGAVRNVLGLQCRLNNDTPWMPQLISRMLHRLSIFQTSGSSSCRCLMCYLYVQNADSQSAVVGWKTQSRST